MPGGACDVPPVGILTSRVSTAARLPAAGKEGEQEEGEDEGGRVGEGGE